MAEFKFFHPIEVRYGDLDPQGHVNSSKYLTYCETARVAYLRNLDLWQPGSFLNLGIILADARVTYQVPILYGQDIHVGARVTRLGNKSLDMEYIIEERNNGRQFAVASAVLVAFDYASGSTIPVPGAWRRAITAFEQLQPA